MLMNRRLALTLSLALILGACASVDVTKTGKGAYAPTDPNTIDILKTRPDRAFEELGTVTVTGFNSDESAKMHNAIRSKSAPLGATAVILTEEGMFKEPFGMKRWATGVAILYK
jgi:ABC-type glycerol-3-phosphate transport system substrate-binding protein